MKASILDLRRHMRGVLHALERNEPVTIFHRGKKKGVLYPEGRREGAPRGARNHPAFGLWKDREDLKDVPRHVRRLRLRRMLRRGRRHAL
jgi:hypothetical protein